MKNEKKKRYEQLILHNSDKAFLNYQTPHLRHLLILSFRRLHSLNPKSLLCTLSWAKSKGLA